ncbi:DNA methyltransferase [Weissella cibaria]|uniref:site-specific DNA-methyltransferase n=1 Tax=Weissella cibaria TaxID=137591 RepID=UPI0024556B0E|nr:site-specific DNA-methyltransferase [Weissella cibaria]MDH5013109.1 DNA methyltransferase [Weissella cibaria]
MNDRKYDTVEDTSFIDDISGSASNHTKANTYLLKTLQKYLPEFMTDQGFDMKKFESGLREINISEIRDGYTLDFVGKSYAQLQTGQPTKTVILPDVENNAMNKNKDSENLFFTGDNLDVLKQLQKAYTNAIDFMYIDPPYNTGTDGFIYNDKFDLTDDDLRENLGFSDQEIKRLHIINGRNSHSAWLTFMYPRLKIAQRLLTDEGVIFISIDDNEKANLKLLLDEVFGEDNFISELIWKGKGGGQDSTYFVPVHESIFVYAKNKSDFSLGTDSVDDDESGYAYFDELRQLKYKRQLARKWGANARREDRPNLFYAVQAPDGSDVFPKLPDGTDGNWRHNKDRLNKEIQDGEFEFVKTNDEWILYQKIFASADGKKVKKFTNLIDDISSGSGTKHVKALFDGIKVFDYPKPTDLIKKFLSMIDDDGIRVLDFFAGSGSTADAVMQLNAEDGGQRTFIMATLDESTLGEKLDLTKSANQKKLENNPDNYEFMDGKYLVKSEAYKIGFDTIDKISKDRIKRASDKIKNDNLLAEDFDGGFKSYFVKEVKQDSLDVLTNFDSLELNLFDDMIKPFSSESIGIDGGATGHDTLLRTWMTDDGYKFDTQIVTLDIEGQLVEYVDNTRAYIIDDGWNADNTKRLINMIGTNELAIQTIVVYGHSLTMESMKELELAVKQLDVSVHLIRRY